MSLVRRAKYPASHPSSSRLIHHGAGVWIKKNRVRRPEEASQRQRERPARKLPLRSSAVSGPPGRGAVRNFRKEERGPLIESSLVDTLRGSYGPSKSFRDQIPRPGRQGGRCECDPSNDRPGTFRYRGSFPFIAGSELNSRSHEGPSRPNPSPSSP